MTAGRAARWIYAALIVHQSVWHALLPPPAGNGNWVLAALATAPLLIPLRGVLRERIRDLTWAGYLSMLYLIIGVMEAWANPPQRPVALLQVALVVTLVASILAFSRARGPEK